MDFAIAFIALTAMEIVLGIDNIVFITILVGKLPEQQRALARNIGLGLALVMRIALLFTLSWILSLKEPLFSLSQFGVAGAWLAEHAEVNEVSLRDLILLAGGLFLIGKSVFEIHEKIEGHSEKGKGAAKHASFSGVLIQITLLDIIFSLDSVITAVGMVKSGEGHEGGIPVMVAAIVVAVIVMLIFAGAVGRFVERHPTVKMLALSFLILIGVMLTAEGIGTHIDKGYIYFAMAFAVGVEMLNIRIRGKGPAQPVRPLPKTE